ncbi:MAG: type II toxin-antitoxin system HicA family toxin [Candidatus Aminicenantales bacterium]
MKVKEAIEMIEKDGWFMVRRKGSHRQFKHNSEKGLVTIAGHLNDDLAKGTINSIFKQAGLNYGRKENV